MIFSPASNFWSNFVAFIQFHLFIPGPPDRDQADILIAPGDHCRPVLLTDLPDHHPAGLIGYSSRDLDHSRIGPKLLSLLEFDAVFALVRVALIAVVLEAHRRLALGGILKVYLVYHIGVIGLMRCASGPTRPPGAAL